MEFEDGYAKSNSQIMLDEDGSLVIRYAKIEQDNGEYRCSAENKYGKESAVYKVTVTKKSKITTESKDIPFAEGSTFTFDCEIEVRFSYR